MKTKSTHIFLISILFLGSYWIACDSTEMMSAKVYIQENNLEKAEELALLAVENEPLNPLPSYWIGVNVYSKQKRWEELTKMFDLSLSISDQFAKEIANERERHWVDEFNDGANAFNTVLNQESPNQDSTLEKTLASFANAVLLLPDRAQTYASIASVYLHTKEVDKAKEYLSKAAELDPTDTKTLLNLSILYSQEKDFEAANVQLKIVLEAEPGNLRALQQMAQNLDALGNAEEAEVMYKKALEADPDNANLVYNLGVIYLRADEYEKAEEMFIKSLALNPDDCDAISNVSVIYSKMDDKLDDAAKFLLKAADCAPTEHIYWRQLVGIYMKMGNPKEAQKAMDKAKELGYNP